MTDPESSKKLIKSTNPGKLEKKTTESLEEALAESNGIKKDSL